MCPCILRIFAYSIPRRRLRGEHTSTSLNGWEAECIGRCMAQPPPVHELARCAPGVARCGGRAAHPPATTLEPSLGGLYPVLKIARSDVGIHYSVFYRLEGLADALLPQRPEA
ncbi:hypothetical protein HAX54_030415, partial [Datura stramonium]|nr:hypothetical protein [Datura stramonium]